MLPNDSVTLSSSPEARAVKSVTRLLGLEAALVGRRSRRWIATELFAKIGTIARPCCDALSNLLELIISILWPHFEARNAVITWMRNVHKEIMTLCKEHVVGCIVITEDGIASKHVLRGRVARVEQEHVIFCDGCNELFNGERIEH